MNYTYEPDDEAASIEARRQLTARFEETPRGHDLGWVANQVMEFKSAYLDGNLSRWRPSEVETILLGLYPAKAVLDPEDLKRVIAGFSAFLRFLGAEGIVPRGDAVRMAELVERFAPQFHEAAFDVGRWSMGKRLFAQARSEGVDMSDADALRRFSDEFNQRSFSERDAVLGPIPGSETPALRQARIEPLPPVVLPSTDELESAARATVLFGRLGRLLAYIGGGRPLTDKGNLKLADGKALVDLLETGDSFDGVSGDRVFKTRSSVELHGVDLAFRIALGSEMLVRRGRKVVPGPNAGREDEPLETVYEAWLALLEGVGPTQHWYRHHRYGFGWFAKELDSAFPMILVDIYRDGFALIDEVVEEAWEHLLALYDLDDVDDDRLEFHRSMIDSSVRRTFDCLGELGTVAVAEEVEVPTTYGGTDRFGGVVELTPLGKWVVQRFASGSTSAPVVGRLRETTAAELLRAAADIPEAEAIAEIDEWVDHHGDDAAPELVDALRTADETGRGLGFRALLRLGTDASSAVSELGDDPGLAAFVTVWRVDTLTGSPDEMDCAGDPDRFVRLLGAVIELWGPDAAARGWAGPAAGSAGLASMLDQAWRVKRPQTEQVLAAIGAEHPDKAVTKAARKALFKHSSAR